ncbi:hypothetical protein [Flavivirga jejuensis]|uniref:Uncharacterized protein n=1 Tax=Flavivirga jejuensis TaxID=870487 RepID=A0ABT8WPQ6_9FLAO|nr:hypothetical protein [Flavivirga jejuensis]MDO5975135.1 hypothetical protein [Flavivirga jejuensis]
MHINLEIYAIDTSPSKIKQQIFTSKFNAIKVFRNLIKDEVITIAKEWFYKLTAVTGFQFIENNEKQSTYLALN